MGHKRFLSITVVLFASLALLNAKIAFRPEVHANVGLSFCIPTADYLKQYPGDPEVKNPPIRTSWSYCIDVNPIGLFFGVSETTGFGFSAGVSYLNTSPSIAYGISILKPYNGFGFDVGASYQFNGVFSLGARYRYLDCRYAGSRNHFLVQELGLEPSLCILAKGCRLSFEFPVSASLKADAITLRIGASVLISMDATKGEAMK